MELPLKQDDPENLIVKWEEEDLRLIASVYVEKLNLQIEEVEVADPEQLLDADIAAELNQFLDSDIVLARAFVDKEKHLAEPDKIPYTWLAGMVDDLRQFASRTVGQAKADQRRIGQPHFNNLSPIARIEFAKKAFAMAMQLADPEAAARNEKVVADLEAAFEQPAPGEMLELPAGSAESDEPA
jgi:hypothetical protein